MSFGWYGFVHTIPLAWKRTRWGGMPGGVKELYIKTQPGSAKKRQINGSGVRASFRLVTSVGGGGDATVFKFCPTGDRSVPKDGSGEGSADEVQRAAAEHEWRVKRHSGCKEETTLSALLLFYFHPLPVCRERRHSVEEPLVGLTPAWEEMKCQRRTSSSPAIKYRIETDCVRLGDCNEKDPMMPVRR
ncbi:hypothetical protein LX32DRAFT_277385 [Colletotrichum zoysiae]|uniref:Uncharacterized protein n=1 Tax=Colletotrichum zoysiae TaxID=1216348 RepID=A0AAD9H2B6_9PEZI|nr:hypothetical protein LX32DRAFT_277385 [Colletotrichum zoysiae]